MINFFKFLGLLEVIDWNIVTRGVICYYFLLYSIFLHIKVWIKTQMGAIKICNDFQNYSQLQL